MSKENSAKESKTIQIKRRTLLLSTTSLVAVWGVAATVPSAQAQQAEEILPQARAAVPRQDRPHGQGLHTRLPERGRGSRRRAKRSADPDPRRLLWREQHLLLLLPELRGELKGGWARIDAPRPRP